MNVKSFLINIFNNANVQISLISYVIDDPGLESWCKSLMMGNAWYTAFRCMGHLIVKVAFRIGKVSELSRLSQELNLSGVIRNISLAEKQLENRCGNVPTRAHKRLSSTEWSFQKSGW